MSVLLSPIGNAWQFFDGNGKPLNAGQLNTYAAGTSTPQATFTTSTGNVQNANPIVLNPDGRLANEVWLTNNVAYKFILADSTGVTLGSYDNISGIASQLVLNSYLSGLTMSATGSSATMTIAAGQATDSTNIAVMTLAASIAKTTSGWAVGTGNGGLDAGSIANATWYHFFLIQRPDTNVTDILFSTSAVAPALPTNYTIFRRIGSGLTDGAAQWVAFIQDGDLFQWKAVVVNDVSSTNPGTSAVLRTLKVPLGVNVIARFVATLFNADATVCDLWLSDPATTDIAPTGTMGFIGVVSSSGNYTNSTSGGAFEIRTNTASQVRSRIEFSSANVTLNINTIGWIDRRGRDS